MKHDEYVSKCCHYGVLTDYCPSMKFLLPKTTFLAVPAKKVALFDYKLNRASFHIYWDRKFHLFLCLAGNTSISENKAKPSTILLAPKKQKA